MKKYEFIDLSYLDLMSDGDMDMKSMMLDMLQEEIPVEIEKMSDLEAAKDWKQLREVSHKMKSTLSFVGNADIINANKEIEEIAKSEENMDRLPALLSILIELYPQILSELKEESESL